MSFLSLVPQDFSVCGVVREGVATRYSTPGCGQDVLAKGLVVAAEVGPSCEWVRECGMGRRP